MAGPLARLVVGLIENQLEPEEADLTNINLSTFPMRPVFREAELIHIKAQRAFSVRDEEDCPRVEVFHSSHLVTKRHHAAIVGFDFHQMEGDVPVELLEESDSITYQDRQDRIANLVRQSETKALG